MTNEKRLRVDAMQEEEHDSIAKEIAALYAPFSSLLSRCLRVDAERPTRWRSREDVWGRNGGRRVPSAAQSNELLSLFFFVRGFFPFRLGAALDLLAFSNLLPLFHLTKKNAGDRLRLLLGRPGPRLPRRRRARHGPLGGVRHRDPRRRGRQALVDGRGDLVPRGAPAGQVGGIHLFLFHFSLSFLHFSLGSRERGKRKWCKKGKTEKRAQGRFVVL